MSFDAYLYFAPQVADTVRAVERLRDVGATVEKYPNVPQHVGERYRVRYPHGGTDYYQFVGLVRRINQEQDAALKAHFDKGKCRNCGRATELNAPWYPLCYHCDEEQVERLSEGAMGAE